MSGLYRTDNMAKWVRMGDATLSDQGSRMIPPGEGWLVNPKTAMNGALPGSGLARDHAFRQPLPAGNTLVSLGFPFAMSPASNHLLLADGFIKSTSQSYSDKFLIWAGDATPGAANWVIYWYFGPAGQPQTAWWVKSGDANFVNQDQALLFPKQRAFMAQILAGYPKPQRTVPCPWTP